MFSGCARVNGRGELLLIYTSVKHRTRDDRVDNEQWGARPLDAELVTWEKHPENPVLALPTHGGPRFHKDSRDPFVFTADGRSFLVLSGETDAVWEVALYEAVDESLLRWRYCGPLVFEPVMRGADSWNALTLCRFPPASPAGQAKWILLTSPYNLVEYTTGTFDTRTLTFAPEQHGILDAGHDDLPNFYATNILEDTEGNCVLLGWRAALRRNTAGTARWHCRGC